MASLIYNFNRNPKKDPKGKTWDAWYPEWTKAAKKKRKMSPKEMKNYWVNNVVPIINNRAKKESQPDNG